MPETKTNRTKSAVAATPHPQAAAAAAEALRRGGNAVDAACAATFTLCVVLPGMVGIGGYGGCMVAHLAGRGTVAIDFDSEAPRAYRDDLYMPDPKVGHTGYLAVSVPGVVAGLDLAIREFGKLTFRDATTHALGLARDGVKMEAAQRGFLERWHARADVASRKAFFPGGGIPETGAIWKQPDLARLIQRLGDEGPSALYSGEVPRQIARQIHDHGGILSEEDFASYKPTLVDPLTISYRGHELYTPPPPSGGLTTLQILNALERFDVKSMEPFGAQYLHTLAEVTRACWRDRDQYLGDPDVIKIPYAELLSEKRAADIANNVTDRATPLETKPAAGADSEHTINVLTTDAGGNVCSLTATQGEMWGSAVVIEGLGLVMGHGMSRFTYVPGSPNAPAPGKRMHHNMSPIVITRDGRPRFVVGMPGGQKIPNVTAQIIVNLIDFGKTPLEAIKAPRLHTTGDEPVNVSASVPRAVVAELEARGHTFKKAPSMGGPANAMAIDPHTRTATAASEAGAKGVAEM